MTFHHQQINRLWVKLEQIDDLRSIVNLLTLDAHVFSRSRLLLPFSQWQNLLSGERPYLFSKAL